MWHFLVASVIFFLAIVAYEITNLRHDYALKNKPLPIKRHKSTLNRNSIWIENLSSLHLFGIAQARINDVPTSNLQLKVSGIIYQQNDAPKALVSIDGQASKIFKEGDEPAYGVKIYTITRDSVIIKNNGRLEKLTLARPPLEFKAYTKETL